MELKIYSQKHCKYCDDIKTALKNVKSFPVSKSKASKKSVQKSVQISVQPFVQISVKMSGSPVSDTETNAGFVESGTVVTSQP